MYVLGIDAGGTKTHCAVADRSGRTIAEGFGGAGNYQTCGIRTASQSMRTAVSSALQTAGIRLEDIACAVFGISGADEQEDFDVLVPAVKDIMGTVKFRVFHDAWLGLRAGTSDCVGVVSICGTGAGHVGRNRQGQKLSLRNLDYITGNYGGGGDIERKALHYAFRSEEGTFQKSRLEEEIPEIFNVKCMEEVCRILRRGEMTGEQRFQIPITVFSLAREGDEVSEKIIRELGYEEGRYAAAVFRRLGMCSESVPAVLIGSLFQTGEPLLIYSYMQAVHEAAPGAHAVILQAAPVAGAVSLALDIAGGVEY